MGRVKKISGVPKFVTSITNEEYVYDSFKPFDTKMLNFPTALPGRPNWYYQENEIGTLATDCALVPESIIHVPSLNDHMK